MNRQTGSQPEHNDTILYCNSRVMLQTKNNKDQIVICWLEMNLSQNKIRLTQLLQNNKTTSRNSIKESDYLILISLYLFILRRLIIFFYWHKIIIRSRDHCHHVLSRLSLRSKITQGGDCWLMCTQNCSSQTFTEYETYFEI